MWNICTLHEHTIFRVNRATCTHRQLLMMDFDNLIDCIFMDQAGSGDEFLELGHKWCMGIVHDVR